MRSTKTELIHFLTDHKLHKLCLCVFTALTFCFALQAEGLVVESGVYRSLHSFITVRTDLAEDPETGLSVQTSPTELVSRTLQTFYTYYYDGEYTPEPDSQPFFAAQIGEGLYLDFWYRSDTEENLWLPGSNMTSATLSPARRRTRIFAWYADSRSSQPALQIPYWTTDADFYNDSVSLDLPDGETCSLPRFIQLGDMVYTCVPGRGRIIRNPIPKNYEDQDFVFSSDGKVMASGTPDYTKTDISDMPQLIRDHNSIVYPPRFSKIDLREPSIYRMLEDWE